jgi:hypothetical protein
LALLLGAANAPAQLASDRIRILGVSLEVSPPSLTAPRNVPILLNTALVDGDGADVSARADVSGARVLARLSGPGVDGVQTLEAAPGERLEIAPATTWSRTSAWSTAAARRFSPRRPTWCRSRSSTG